MSRRLFLTVAVLALAGCLKSPPPTAGLAPDFELADLAGGKASLASLRGKVVVLDFWATWCGPCLTEIPEYAAFHQRNSPRGVEVIGVAIDSGEPVEIQDFVREHKVPYRQLIGDDKVADAYQANALPTTFVIGPDGSIKTKIVGTPAGKFETLQKSVDAALNSR